MSDLHAVERDDRITVSGVTDPGPSEHDLAKSIKIDLANPLYGGRRNAPRPAKSTAEPTSKAKKGGDADDLLGGGK